MATDMAEGKTDTTAVHGPARPAGGPAATQRPGSGPASTAGSRRPGLALLVISLAQLMLVLDELIVNTALPHIQRALHFSGTGLDLPTVPDAPASPASAARTGGR